METTEGEGEMLTEDEAKQKWCPMTRVLDWQTAGVMIGENPAIASAAVNRVEGGSGIPVDAYCIGSDCMMWRWQQQQANEPFRPVGWCGLASRPETV
jgi:hypothetical protein